ncbi:chloride channel protein, partial [Salmonella enterica subsp. enterica serovar Kentucky]|nr:chloride channel protein [Salmonella enterica subsp. enterica serovar Kentucky]
TYKQILSDAALTGFSGTEVGGCYPQDPAELNKELMLRGLEIPIGREGPTVQIGGNLGRMVLDVFRMRSAEARHTLLATGAAAGLS